VLIELFSLGVTAEALQANIGSKSAISLATGAGFSSVLSQSTRLADRRTPFSRLDRPAFKAAR